MKKYCVMMVTILISSLLVGCSDKIDEIKDAVSGIDNQADKAAKAISLDAHSIRSFEINYENNSFTINDLFKTILRDTQWEYEQNDTIHTLIVKGAWKEPLLANYNLSIEKDKLNENGKVIVELQFEENNMNEEKTKVVLKYNDNIVFEQEGKEVLLNLYDTYINTTKNF